ncbi:NADH-quinone oxidoreductase subunit A [Vulgatibacter sp.]|uniref:NADH-quinone oxidoreductase subunit A n=1 Tax=Vulgatibacter sp. TaxID=1971226 RepID=UPI003563E631
MEHLPNWFPILVVVVIATVMVLVLTFLSWLLGPKRMTAIKATAFECGSESSGSARERFSVKFYMVALLFVVFDVEAVFLYPWAVLFKELAWPGFIVMGIFLFPVVIGLVYEWKKGAMEWD